ncbi:hypothetical protein BDW74DRAFT_89430 [Aspergillus multicolor]|uniref:tetratricopeptide repeat protein n=1 Tax=Aspergillus multicolor TaxID=41759 RepID=UPI003CCCC625
MANLAITWKSLGNLDAALTLMDECVQLCREVLGSDHRQTVSLSGILRDWRTAQQARLEVARGSKWRVFMERFRRRWHAPGPLNSTVRQDSSDF